MSAFSRNSNSNNNAKKPFCKVCADAGKTDTAHFVRATPDPNSAVVCPTLKALECRYCYKNGHTVKYCPVLKQNNKEKDRQERQQRRVTAPAPSQSPATIAPVKTGKFAMLDLDDEEEVLTTTFAESQTIQMPTIDNSFPSLCASASVASVTNNTWASMAASVAHIPEPKPQAKPKSQPSTQQNILYEDDDDDASEYDDAKLAIGDELYYKIVTNHQSQAGMIVGMLLELEDSELNIILRDSRELNLRVAECVEVLQSCAATRARPVVYEDDDW
uniref:Nanos-type domain-containing protein n=1 Tax=viral metagenome TaxID=1070528 RepID=A0A6C0I7Q6_9ZZZZ